MDQLTLADRTGSASVSSVDRSKRLYSFRLPGLVRGNEQSAISRAMKPEIGVRFAGPDKLVHLIGAGEVAKCRR